MQSGLATRYAPSFALVRAHFALGLAGLVVFSVGLVARAADVTGYFFQPQLLGLVHACVLGWLLPIALGALHQLVPVVFEVPVRSERLAWGAFGLYVASVVPFVAEMWRLHIGPVLAIAATLAAASVWLYVANLALTLLSSRVRSLTGAYVVASLAYLALAVAVGAMLAWNLYRPYLPYDHLSVLRAHAHAAALGFFGLLVMGVAYRLMEMFLLSHGSGERAGWVALVAINVAVAALFVGFWLTAVRWLVTLGIAAATVGIGAFLVQVRAIWRRRMRRAAGRETAWRHTLTSFAYLGLALVLGVVVAVTSEATDSWDRLVLANGILALPGFVGTIVVGQLYKILPFLVWLHRFSRFVGLKKVPSASEMLGERPKAAQFALMHAGTIGLVAGVLVDAPALRLAGALAFAGSTALVAANLGVIHSRTP